MKLFGFYRPDYIGSLDLNGTSLNGKYTLSFWLNGQYGDFVKAGVISIKDMEVPTDRYTKEIAPGIKDLREFIYMEYNENYINEDLMNKIIGKIGQRFDLEILNTGDAKAFIRKNTDLKEVSEGKFLIQEETEMMGEIIPAKYLIID